MGQERVDRNRLIHQLKALGVEKGAVLVVHASFRTLRPVQGGPSGVIEAILDALGPQGTLVMPSMTDWDDDRVFEVDATPCRDMGIVADTFWRMPGVLRSDSPHSFAAYGPQAEVITAPHPPEIPHGPDSPVGRVHDLDGQVLLLGVDHDANTTVHLAESLAGVPYRVPKRCTVLRHGVPTSVQYGETDHCCRNFTQIGSWLHQRGLERRGLVGHAAARLVRARDVVATVVEELRAGPCRLLCPRGSDCDECEEAWLSVDRGQVDW